MPLYAALVVVSFFSVVVRFVAEEQGADRIWFGYSIKSASNQQASIVLCIVLIRRQLLFMNSTRIIRDKALTLNIRFIFSLGWRIESQATLLCLNSWVSVAVLIDDDIVILSFIQFSACVFCFVLSFFLAWKYSLDLLLFAISIIAAIQTVHYITSKLICSFLCIYVETIVLYRFHFRAYEFQSFFHFIFLF